MTNALKEEDIQKLMQDIKAKMKDRTLLTAKKGVDENGKDIFVYAMEEAGSLTLSPDANGEYQLVKLEGQDPECRTIICVGFNSLVKSSTGKDWPDKQ